MYRYHQPRRIPRCSLRCRTVAAGTQLEIGQYYLNYSAVYSPIFEGSKPPACYREDTSSLLQCQKDIISKIQTFEKASKDNVVAIFLYQFYEALLPYITDLLSLKELSPEVLQAAHSLWNQQAQATVGQTAVHLGNQQEQPYLFKEKP